MSRHAQTDLLAIWLAEYPQPMLEIFDEVARRMTLRVFPNYGDIQQEIHVRITDLPIMDTMRELRQLHLNGLVRVSGVVTRRTSVFPQLKVGGGPESGAGGKAMKWGRWRVCGCVCVRVCVCVWPVELWVAVYFFF